MRVVLSGSMRHEAAIAAVASVLARRGHDVHVPAPTPPGVDPQRLDAQGQVALKAGFVADHLAAIRAADALLVVNVDTREARGYVGASALVELAFATALAVPTFLLHSPGPQPHQLDVLALQPVILDGDPMGVESVTT